jgi:hypothetical protein
MRFFAPINPGFNYFILFYKLLDTRIKYNDVIVQTSAETPWKLATRK